MYNEMVRIWRISLTYFPTYFFVNFSFYLSVFFPVNNVLNLSRLIVFRYLILGVITFCGWRIRLKTAGISIMPFEYKVSLRGS